MDDDIIYWNQIALAPIAADILFCSRYEDKKDKGVKREKAPKK